uniref:Chloroplast ascorbate peroxidase 4 n=1 Tax=Gymnochlora stellata TaxID=67809 RepID=B5A4H6_GYMST|nr:chloroplast ascorbate peroxidase 4 [Gymnochlora stellata]
MKIRRVLEMIFCVLKVGEIKAAQDAINAEWKSEDKLSFADILVFTAFLKTKQAFNTALSSRSTNGGGATIAAGFGNPFDIPPIGRAEASASSGKSVSFTIPDLYNALKSMGFSARDITSLAIAFPGSEDLESVESALSELDPKIKGFVKGAQQSRRTVTQNSYQVNVGEAFNKLAVYRQPKINPLSYYYPAPKLDYRKLKL